MSRSRLAPKGVSQAGGLKPFPMRSVYQPSTGTGRGRYGLGRTSAHSMHGRRRRGRTPRTQARCGWINPRLPLQSALVRLYGHDPVGRETASQAPDSATLNLHLRLIYVPTGAGHLGFRLSDRCRNLADLMSSAILEARIGALRWGGSADGGEFGRGSGHAAISF